jgi:hypothetical protein
MDDMAKLQWLNDLDRRSMVASIRSQPGKADASVVQELRDIAAEYEKLLQAGPPRLPIYTDESVRAKIAEVHNTVGRASESLGDFPEAMKEYTLAADRYMMLGRDADIERSQTNRARVEEAQKGGADDEFRRLQARLATLKADSVDQAETLIELAGLHSRNHDDHEAEKLYLRAERALDKESGDPSGLALARALTGSLLGSGEGKSIETMMKISGLYRVLSMGLARIYRTSNPTKAQYYTQKANERDSRAQNDAFSAAMREALRGPLGK